MQSTVVVGYDQTPHSERALVEAAREATWRGASLVVVNAYAFTSMPTATPVPYVPIAHNETIQQVAAEIAEHGAEIVRSRFPAVPVESKVFSGVPGYSLATAARAADLLVVGNRGRGGFAGLLLGSVSMRALTESCVPTMVVRGQERDPQGVVLAAVDIEQPADDLLDFAFAEASRRGARLEAVTAWDMSWAADYAGDSEEVRRATDQATADLDAALDALVHTWSAKYPDVQATHRVADGTPPAVLTEASRHADLLVVGARHHGDGRHGMRVGPVGHSVLHHADCPVVVVPRD